MKIRILRIFHGIKVINYKLLKGIVVKINKYILMIFAIVYWQGIFTEALSIAVPKESLAEKASLVLVMLDRLGNECVGTCQLSEKFEDRKILKEDLSIQSESVVNQLHDSVDITCSSKICDSQVLLHLDFDRELQVVKVLLVKDNLLADNPFDVVSIALNSHQFEEDDLDALFATVDAEAVAESMPAQTLSRLEMCKLYIQLAWAVQCSYAKRKINNLASWFNLK